MNNQVNSSTANQNDEDEINLLELINTIVSGKWVIALSTLFALSLAIIFAFGQQPIYKSDALLQVEKKKAAIPGIDDITGLGGNDASVGTELEIIKSRKILGDAVDELKLNIIAYPNRVRLLGNFYKSFFNKKSINKPPAIWEKFDNLISPYAWGNESIQVSRLELNKNMTNEKLTLISNGDNTYEVFLNEKFLLKGKVGHFAKSNETSLKINISELIALKGTTFTLIKLSKLRATATLQKTIKASEKGRRTGIIRLSLEGSNKKLIASTLDRISNTYLNQNKSRSSEEASSALKFLKEQIKPVKERSEIAEANLKTYRTNNQTADMSMETRAVLDVVSGIDTELQKLLLRKDELGQKYTINHPTIRSITSQEKNLNQSKTRTLAKISKLPETQQQLLKLEGDYKVANSIYIELLNNIQEFEIAKASSVGNVYIIDPAVAHDHPVKPQKTRILAIGGLLGALLGTLIVFIRKAFHRTVHNPEKLEEATGIPVYATVPLAKTVKLTSGLNKKKQQQKSLLAIDNKSDPAIESLRSLRTSLHFALLEAKNNIVMITGPSPGIGKSFISSNFAAVIASSEQRVLLIDADMRKGYLHKLLTEKVSPGLSELISDKSTLEETIRTVQVGENTMDIITRGQTPPNPSELLMHSRFGELLNKLSSDYDLILIDTPPVHAVTDPTIIGKHSGVVFMVCRSDQHSMKEIEHAVTRLAHNGIDTKGFIFNGYVAKKSTYGYGGYGYHSYYGDYTSDK